MWILILLWAHGCQTVMFHSFRPKLVVRSLRTVNLPGARAETLAGYAMYCMLLTVTNSLLCGDGGWGGSAPVFMTIFFVNSFVIVCGFK